MRQLQALLLGQGGLRLRHLFRHVERQLHRMAMAGVALMVAALCAVAAIGCVLAALWLFAAPHLGAPLAALTTAAALILLGAAVLVWARRLLRVPLPGLAPDVPLPDLAKEFSDNRGTLLLAALAAGLLAGNARRGF